jgi:hypothetical protein
LKILVAANIKIKEIFALEITDGKIDDGKMMCEFIDHILKQNNTTTINIKTVISYDVYENNKNFKYLQNKKIQSSIKIRKNSIIFLKNNKIRNKEKENVEADRWLK